VEEERVLVDINCAAQMCRVSRATIYRWMKRKLVDWVVLPLGRRRIYLDSLFKEPPRPMDAIP
jgi:predicted DNA-binding transcriptional regulator AlpA